MLTYENGQALPGELDYSFDGKLVSRLTIVPGPGRLRRQSSATFRARLAMLRILIVEGNTARKCAEAREHGMATQSELYMQNIQGLAHDAACDVVNPADAGSALARDVDLAQYDGVAWTGSSLNVYHATPEIRRQVEFAKACFAAGTEMFGSCWGLQVAAVAAGGVVSANARGREIGIARKIELTDAGRAHGLFANKPRVFDSVAIHLDHVTTLPDNASVLARNAYSDVQALEIRRGASTFWGVQYHPEFDLAYIAGLMRRYRAPMVREGLARNEATVDELADTYEQLAREPGRSDLRWQLSVDDDVLEPGNRLRELANWLARLRR